MEIMFFAILLSGAVDEDLSDLVYPGEPERIAADLKFTEGPVWHPDGYLLFSDIPADIIYRWNPDGRLEKFRYPSGNSNGLTFDRQGRLIACEHGNRRVSRTEADGTVVTLADRYQGIQHRSYIGTLRACFYPHMQRYKAAAGKTNPVILHTRIRSPDYPLW